MPNHYVPRAFAQLAQRHFLDNPRCALHADMGMGKTSLVLSMLESKYSYFGENKPTLIIAPRLVARDVWRDEAAKWHHTKHLDITPIVGTPKERIAALRKDVPIKTINYENLPWLIQEMAKQRTEWPFDTVIADESTKLKSFRLSQGGQRAGALRKIAHTKVTSWINLTGTPAPNGLLDLWGQFWFIDQGARLGRLFESFKHRYMYALTAGSGGFSTLVPFKGAAEEIADLIKDVCLTLKYEDWYPLDKIITNVISVHLPSKAMQQYRQFAKDLVMELEGKQITAVAAAAKSIKLVQLAAGAVLLNQDPTQEKKLSEWLHVHDEKLDALSELLDQHSSPVLVGYHFRADAERILKRFPDALDLSVPEQLEQAKQGKGKLWLGHPASMGHGVDGLQNHCHTVCFFTSWWSSENADQFIARVGPVRQTQSGKNKVVTVHYLVCKGTIDEDMINRQSDKRSIQQTLSDHTRRFL